MIASVKEKLDYFLHSKNIPHIIFHGPSGSGNRTVVQTFLHQVYGGDTTKMKKHVMVVNCSHGKGIKFIREDLNFFAKTNIQSNYEVMFKSIVLLNADSLTIDAQSALRRCIEIFSHNTRFFIVVENKHKLLNPILSRFCEIYIPEPIDNEGNFVNLHQTHLETLYPCQETRERDRSELRRLMDDFKHLSLIDMSTLLYERGFSARHLIQLVYDDPILHLCYYKLKTEFRCEKMLMFYLLYWQTYPVAKLPSDQTTPGVSRPLSLVVDDLRPSDQTTSDQTSPVALPPAKLVVEGLRPSDQSGQRAELTHSLSDEKRSTQSMKNMLLV